MFVNVAGIETSLGQYWHSYTTKFPNESILAK